MILVRHSLVIQESGSLLALKFNGFPKNLGWNDVSWNNPESVAKRLGSYAK
jgi:hypothetical protein